MMAGKRSWWQEETEPINSEETPVLIGFSVESACELLRRLYRALDRVREAKAEIRGLASEIAAVTEDP